MELDKKQLKQLEKLTDKLLAFRLVLNAADMLSKEELAESCEDAYNEILKSLKTFVGKEHIHL